MQRNTLYYTLIVLGMAIGLGAQPAGAELQAFGPVDANNGFPDWYQDTNGLKLELCLDQNGFCLTEEPNPAQPINFPDNFGAEAFWWAAEAAVAFTGGSGLLTLAMEAAFANEDPVEGDQVAFGRIRIRIDVDQPGTYRITHPFGVYEQVVDAVGAGNEINDTNDIGNFLDPGRLGDYSVALGSGIGPFLFWDSGLPLNPSAGLFYIGDPAQDHAVLGSPLGTNFFRIERDGVLVAETNLFSVMGKVFIGDGNTAPIANPDNAATALNTPILIDVLANDTAVNIPINPTSFVFSNLVGGTAAIQIVNGRPMVNFTPATGFTGNASFDYSVASFTGLISTPATVGVIVEDLRTNSAVLRPKFMKWLIKGTSSDTTDNVITARLATGTLSTSLTGAGEVPPVTTNATGSATVNINEALSEITFTLNVQNIVNITAAHIHVGAPGVNGPIILSLSATDFASPLTGALSAADLVARPAQGINTFADAVRAILSGNTYINLHTTANPGGEIRGQLGPVRIIGSAPVALDGTWVIQNTLPIRPDESGTVSIESSNGVQILQIPASIR